MDSDNRELTLPASVTIDTVEELHHRLTQSTFKEREPFVVDISGVETITTPGVQLILSLERSLEQENSKLVLHGITEHFRAVCKLLGLEQKLTSWSETNGTCG